MVPVDCRSVSTAGHAEADTLRVVVHIDTHRPRTRLLVRVDPLSERGAVLFAEGTPPTAGAVSVALTTSAVFQGCVADAPSGFELRAPEAPRGRIWLRVSSNLPVVARLDIGSTPAGSGESDARVVVAPGTSGQAAAGSRR